jgi:tRNA pseudouridine38-40 synthase
MRRYLLDISYLGTSYVGWQIQAGQRSVQSVVEDALAKLAGHPVTITASGRTDAGVHARQQIVHVDLEPIEDPIRWLFSLNCMVPHDISINALYQVRPEAHARFDAIERAYEYHLHSRKNPFRLGQSYFYARPADLDRMNEAARHFLGEQDFESFSKVKTEVNHFRCTIYQAEWQRIDDERIVFHIRANRFLRGMVRAIVGTLLEVGLGRIEVETVAKIIAARDRKAAGRAAPAEGLFLTEVRYPTELGMVRLA